MNSIVVDMEKASTEIVNILSDSSPRKTT